jgi:hypothetical protein
MRHRAPARRSGPPRAGTLPGMKTTTAKKRVPPVKHCQASSHVEDVNHPGHCVWCGLPFERERAPIMPADLADIEYPGSPWESISPWAPGGDS